jgi:tetratricopeptide (TPR) repeat protein
MRRASLRTVLIALFLLVVPAAGAGETTVPKSPGKAWIPESLKMWLEGLELMHTARGDDAVAWLEKKRRERPNDPCVYYFLALAFGEFRYGDDEARSSEGELIEKGLELAGDAESDDPGARYCEGALYGFRAVNRVQTGKYMGAGFDGKRLRRIMMDLNEEYPDFVDTRFWIGTYEYGADVLPGYIKFFKALLLLPGGDRDRGFEMMEEVTRRGILDRFNSHFLLNGFYAEQGMVEAERRVLESFARTYPDFPWATILLAWHFADLDPPDFDRALTLARSAVDAADAREGEYAGELARETRLSLAQIHFQALDHQAVVDTLQPVFEASRGDRVKETEAVFHLLLSLNRTGRHEQAVAIFEDLAKRYPDSPSLPELRRLVDQLDRESGLSYEAVLPARKLARDGKEDEATTAFAELLATYPGDPEILFRAGQFHFDAEHYTHAEAMLRKAVGGSPEKPTYIVPYANLLLGQICDVTGRREQAKGFYRRAREAAGGDLWITRRADEYLKNAYEK